MSLIKVSFQKKKKPSKVSLIIQRNTLLRNSAQYKGIYSKDLQITDLMQSYLLSRAPSIRTWSCAGPPGPPPSVPSSAAAAASPRTAGRPSAARPGTPGRWPPYPATPRGWGRRWSRRSRMRSKRSKSRSRSGGYQYAVLVELVVAGQGHHHLLPLHGLQADGAGGVRGRRAGRRQAGQGAQERPGGGGGRNDMVARNGK